jgi:hypothetical protein
MFISAPKATVKNAYDGKGGPGAPLRLFFGQHVAMLLIDNKSGWAFGWVYDKNARCDLFGRTISGKVGWFPVSCVTITFPIKIKWNVRTKSLRFDFSYFPFNSNLFLMASDFNF